MPLAIPYLAPHSRLQRLDHRAEYRFFKANSSCTVPVLQAPRTHAEAPPCSSGTNPETCSLRARTIPAATGTHWTKIATCQRRERCGRPCLRLMPHVSPLGLRSGVFETHEQMTTPQLLKSVMGTPATTKQVGIGQDHAPTHS